jgi:hypothetical protein
LLAKNKFIDLKQRKVTKMAISAMFAKRQENEISRHKHEKK